MAEDEGLEPTKPKPPVFKTGALPIMLILRTGNRFWRERCIVPVGVCGFHILDRGGCEYGFPAGVGIDDT